MQLLLLGEFVDYNICYSYTGVTVSKCCVEYNTYYNYAKLLLLGKFVEYNICYSYTLVIVR